VKILRLRKIDITGFRGARFPLSLDLTKSCRSMAIYGDNAHGKSTITDAVEWFLTGRVDHLWREDCKEHALRNVGIRDTDDAVVAIEFGEPSFSGSKRIKGDLTVQSSETGDLREYLKDALAERHILRNADLTTFINKSKGEKRGVIAKIIGFQDVVEFRNVILSTRNALQRDPQYLTAKQMYTQATARLLEVAGGIVGKREQLYETANELLKPYKLTRTISDDESYEACVAELNDKIMAQERFEKKLKLDALKTACKDLTTAITSARESQDRFLSTYAKLVENKGKIAQLNLEDFLRKGQDILTLGFMEENRCPLCGNVIDIEQLKTEIEERIDELVRNREEYEAIRTEKDQFLVDLNDITRKADKVRGACAGLKVATDFISTVSAFEVNETQVAASISAKFSTYDSIEMNQERQQKTEALLRLLDDVTSKADTESRALELKDEEARIVDVTRKLGILSDTFDQYETNATIKGAYEEQIESLNAISNDFVGVQNRALQDALDMMSSDISRFHAALHPQEGVDGVRLRIVGEEGVEFEYSFHGKKTYPPIKYLSESQLNSLGIALFLASVRLFNRQSNFFVLDDVVTSFDAGHRRRLLRLLKEEFKEWQIIVLTHEQFWFDIIKRELSPEGWLMNEVDWDRENGVQIKQSVKDLKDLIGRKRKEGFDVANDVRTLLERVLKEMCCALGVKVAFLYNDWNERRMPGELLGALRSTINQKCEPLKGHSIFSKLDGSNIVGTTGSHDNPIDIADADIDVALQDIDELEKLFRCEECGGFVEKERLVTADSRIMCKCGRKAVAWKK
jgi:RecF/RecN/SMC N terminal domain